MNYSTIVKEETTAALLFILENQGIANFAQQINKIYASIDPELLDVISEDIFATIPITAMEATNMYKPELRYVYR